jgi:hypothetical protein
MHIGKQLLDDGFCFVIGALADMSVTANALLVHQDNGRPSPHAKALPPLLKASMRTGATMNAPRTSASA